MNGFITNVVEKSGNKKDPGVIHKRERQNSYQKTRLKPNIFNFIGVIWLKWSERMTEKNTGLLKFAPRMRYHLKYLDQVRVPALHPYSSINYFQSGPSSGTSSTERGASYLVAPRSLCDSEHYTDSGIHHTDSNGMEDEHLIQNDREVRHILGNWIFLRIHSWPLIDVAAKIKESLIFYRQLSRLSSVSIDSE